MIAATDGYIGDEPPYQGHVAVLDAASGSLLHVWNSLSSDRHELLEPFVRPAERFGDLGRAGVVIDRGNRPPVHRNGQRYVGRRGQLGRRRHRARSGCHAHPGNYTPANTEDLNDEDADLRSTSPVLLGNGLIAQGGKDRIIRVLDWRTKLGTAPHRGGEASTVPTPSGNRLFTAPALLRRRRHMVVRG